MKYLKINPQGVPQQPKTRLDFLLTQSLCSIGNFSSTGVKKTTRSSGGALYLQHATASVCVCVCVCVCLFVWAGVRAPAMSVTN